MRWLIEKRKIFAIFQFSVEAVLFLLNTIISAVLTRSPYLLNKSRMDRVTKLPLTLL